jgi:cutinase
MVAINEAKGLFTQAVTKCPNALIVFGGFSQGTAVIHNAVSTLPANVKSKLIAGVLFGDTRNKQDRGQIPNFPKDKVTIFCAKSDGVCGGGLNVTGGHFSYISNGDGPKAIAFLKSKIDAKGRSGAAARMT